MNKMQSIIIKRFVEIVGTRTFSDYSEIIGVEKTRIFRIFNGAEMKISEYEKFSLYIAKYSHEEKVDHDFYEKMSEVIDLKNQNKWQIEIDRQYELNQLLKSA